ncbi:MAG: M48 family metallopeptidase [Clostridiales bacterium]|nr:M48 family metallopeptidase [Clostridiales bacterium]
MDKTIKDIVIIRSNRKAMSLSINDNLQSVVRAPKNISEETIKAFVEKHRDWVDNAIARKAEQINRYNITFEERVEYYSALMGVKPSGIKIISAKKTLRLLQQ